MLIVHLLLRDLQGQFRLTRLLQDQISPSFLIYNVFTGSNQLPIFYLQGFYRVKSVSLFRFTRILQGKPVSLFRFTMLLQGQISLPFSIYSVIPWSNRSLFSIYKVFAKSNQPSLFDLQGFYRVKSVSRFIRLLQGKVSLPFSIFSVFTG